MNIVMHGAGALGAYFGGRLLEGGYNVSFFVRERRAAQLQQEGLKITSGAGDMETKDVEVYTSPEDVSKADVVILAVKGYHLEEAVQQVTDIVNKTGAYVLPLLNGIEQLERLQKAVGKEKVLGGFASIIATLNEKGHVEHTGAGSAIKFGALHPDQHEICTKLEEIHSHVKTNVLRDEEILKSMWKKYILITAFSGITSAMQLPAGYIAKHEASYRTARNVLYEMKMLAEQEGIAMGEEDIEPMAMKLRSFPPQATASMHQDMRKGLPLEVEHLHGGALRIAAKHQVAAPVIETLYGVLKPYENGRPE
ncbi:ketopantoate reductase [Alteribacillus persepolensis]|uniref:2-dehydropantoate 2-reductase n=1 Tax=Alteribacillus persepolensis TaxID=568899 RepID=A0A1G8BZ96_9BACI|nr:2-dehydropantoate 2-reductase [Alteribacillus persepolensis]SDH38373.1 ketopantoate reductase [Alteribacillus persepolensis]